MIPRGPAPLGVSKRVSFARAALRKTRSTRLWTCSRKSVRRWMKYNVEPSALGNEISAWKARGRKDTNILRSVVNSAPTQSRVTDQRAFADLNAGAFSLLVRDHRARLRELPTAALHLGEWHRLVALVLLGLFLVGILVKAFKLIAHPYIPSVHSAVIRGCHDVQNAVEVHVFLF